MTITVTTKETYSSWNRTKDNKRIWHLNRDGYWVTNLSNRVTLTKRNIFK